METRKAQAKGATRMRERGMKLVQVWLDKREAALIGGAAVRARKPLARWIREAAFRAAEKAVDELRKGK